MANAQFYFPNIVGVQDEAITIVDDNSFPFRPQFNRGNVQIQNFGGPRIRMVRKCFVSGDDRSALLGFLASLRGKATPFWSVVNYKARGSFPVAELIPNNDFLSGTAGWAGTNATLTAAGRTLRITSNGGVTTSFANQAIGSMTKNLPYVGRVYNIVNQFAGSTTGLLLYDNAVNQTGALSTSLGLKAVVNVPQVNGTGQISIYNNSAAAYNAGQFTEWGYSSVQQCALVDTGVNANTYSDDYSQAAWTKSQTTIDTNVRTAPDGTNTADRIRETAVTNSHSIYQQQTKSASAQDWCIAAAVCIGNQASARNFAFLYLTDLGSNAATVSFNLTTGAIVQAAGASGTLANARAGSVSLGSGWFYVWMVVNIPASITTFYNRVLLSTDGTTTSYAGDVNGDIGCWRVTCAQSSVPVQLTATGASATTGTPPTGSVVDLKGLPASTNGLLLPGDPVEVNRELKLTVSALNSDASGRGVLIFEPELTTAPPENDFVVFGTPMSKFILASDPQIINQYGLYATVSMELEQVY